MPSNIQLPLATFTNPTIHNLPTIAGLHFWTFFGGSAAQCLNQGSVAGGWSAFGAPTFQPNYVSCLGTAGGLQSVGTIVPSSYSAGATVLSVSRHVIGGTGGVSVVALQNVPAGTLTFQPNVSNTTQATGAGVGIAGTPNPLLIAPTGTPPNTVDTSRFKFYAATAGASQIPNLYDETDGFSATGTAGAAITGGAAVSVLIGANSVTPGGADRRTDHAFMALYNSILSKAQIDQIYAAVKDMLLLRPGTPIIV